MLPWPLSSIVEFMISLIARTTEVGSRTLVHASLWGTKEEVNGKYLNACRVEEESDYAVSDKGAKAQDRLWVCHFIPFIHLVVP